MSLSVIPLTILGQITGVTGSGDTVLYQVSFKSIDGTPLYGVTAVWTDEQAEIEALAAQKPYGVWINPIDGTFTVKFADYTYVGTADLTDDDVLAGVTPIEFTSAEVSDRLLPEVTEEDDGKTLQVIDGQWQAKDAENIAAFPEEMESSIGTLFAQYAPAIIQGAGKPFIITLSWTFGNVEDKEAFIQFGEEIVKIASNQNTLAYLGGQTLITKKYMSGNIAHIGAGPEVRSAGGVSFDFRYDDISYTPREDSDASGISMKLVAALLSEPS